MKAIYKYIALFTALLTVGCDDSFNSEDGAGSVGEGQLSMTMSILSETRSSSAPLESGVLKVYNSEDQLVRRYTDLSSGTVNDYLAVGDYSVVFATANPVSATFDSDEISYYGESGVVSIVSQMSTEVTIEATIQNVVLDINYNAESLDKNFSDYSVVAYAANSIDDVDSNTTQLTYAKDNEADGYFLLSDDVSNLVWQFTGTYADGSENFVMSGVVSDVESAHKYSLTFKYSDNSLNLGGLVVEIGDVESYDDSFLFETEVSEISISGVDFSLSEVQNNSSVESYELEVNSALEIESVSVSFNDGIYEAYGESVSNADLVSFDAETSILTISRSILDGVTAGGVYSLGVEVTDKLFTKCSAELNVGVTGFIQLSDVDFWYNTGAISWYVADDTEDVKIRYKYNDSSDWSDYITATADGSTWTAIGGSEWNEGVNNYGLAISQLTRGFVPSKVYDFEVMIDGVESGAVSCSTSSVSQTIPAIDSSADLSCYSTSNDSADFWDSGNNSYSKTLCSFLDMGDGNYCAKLQSTTVKIIVWSIFAAGNVFSGSFKMGSTSGTVSFGKEFDWEARPQSLNFDYQATVGDDDSCRVFVAIVDWSTQRSVTASSSGTPTGAWDPETANELTEGQIIGYGSVKFGDTTTEMASYELPINYYDTEAKPTSGNYSIVISASASYLGDYMEGSDDSALWLDNFEFGY